MIKTRTRGLIKRMVAPGLGCLLWGVTLYVGISLSSGVVAQRVPGYPSEAQLKTFILLPAGLLGLNVLSILFVRKIPVAALLGIFPIQVFGAIIVLALASGGV